MQRRLYSFSSRDLSVYGAAIGYIFGLFIPLIFRDTVISFDISSIGSVFISDGGFSEFFSLACVQAVYPTLIFLLGFIPCSAPLCALVIFTRSALAAYSSLALSLSGASNALYLLHALCGVCMIAVCFAVSRCAHSFTKSDRSDQSSRVYAFEFLFFIGLIFITVFCRQVALAFI